MNFANMHGLCQEWSMRHLPVHDSALSRYLAPFHVALLVASTIAGFAAGVAHAQQKPNFVGDYAGMLGPLHVKLHVMPASDQLATAL
jgi:hypothetical protein